MYKIQEKSVISHFDKDLLLPILPVKIYIEVKNAPRELKKYTFWYKVIINKTQLAQFLTFERVYHVNWLNIECKSVNLCFLFHVPS